MSEQWLSSLGLAEHTEIPLSTARRYISTFEMFLKGNDRVRGRKYHPDSVVVLTRIKSLYDAGSQTDEIKDILANEFAMTVTTEDETPPPPVAPYATKEDMDRIEATLKMVVTEIVSEIKETNSKNDLLQSLLEDRSNQDELRRQVAELQEEIKELKNKKPRFKFW